MGLPPPKLRDLSTWIEGKSSTGTNHTKVWEIGVPAKNSLSWSIVLSALLSADEVSFPDILKKLIGNESEVREITGKKKLSQSNINADKIKQKLRSFNPFKNRHNIFHEVEISDIVRIFTLRLKRYAYKTKSSTEEWNDDLKLKAASKFLGLKIEVYFPERGESREYSEKSRASPDANITLFEYEDRMHGARPDPINIFYFSMGLQQVLTLKLSALRHFLKKAKISQGSIDKIIKLMNTSETHGAAFLPTILEKGCIDILPQFYKSPYIALKLSEAGFETDPIATISDKPSPLCYALLYSKNSAELKILYDYASNCRSLFDKSSDDTVLNNLERIKRVVESDISILKNFNFDICSTERALHILTQLSRFIEYQYKIVNDLTNLKSKFNSKDINTSDYRKEIIRVIVEHYLNFFQYDSENISQQLSDFVRLSEYYDFTDNFFYLSFFDNFFKLKLLFHLQEENVLSSHIEGKMCLAIKSNKYFPTTVSLNTSADLHSINENGTENILRHIPLYYRNVVQSELISLLQIMKNSEDSQVKEYLKNGCNSYPEIIDEVLISRLNKYLKAVQEISLETNELLCSQFLIIERAMQVIGESIKPSSQSSISCFLLRSCLPIELQKVLISIRNDLSKYRCNSVHGKLKIEKDKKVLEGIKNELKQIQVAFEIVGFTQDFRIEELVMNECFNHLENNVELNEYEMFKKKYDLHLKQRSLDYARKHEKCIELLLDSLSDLQKRSKEGCINHDLHMRYLSGQLKLIEYLVEFIAKKKNEKYLNDLLKEVQNFSIIQNINHEEMQQLIYSSSKWVGEIRKHSPKKNTTLSTPNIESFLESMKQKIVSEDERKQINTLVDKTLKETLHLEPESLDYVKSQKNCLELLQYSLSDLLKQSKAEYTFHGLHMRDLSGQLKSIEYLLEFIAKKKNEKYLNDLLKEVQNFCKIETIKHEQIQTMISALNKWEEEILKQNPKKSTTLSTPNIESFLKSVKQDIFSEDEKKQINTLVEKTVEEAINAKGNLEDIFKKGFSKESIPEVDKLLKKIPLPDNKLVEIRSCYEHEKLSSLTLKPLTCLKKSIIKDIKKMIEENSLSDGHGNTVLIKIVFQRKSNLSSVGLPDALYEKLENFLTSKVNILVDRTKILKNILIDDDEEIKATWKWGRSDAIKLHLKFLMRQRYMRETTVCASLEMAHFDLLNIRHKPLKFWDEERDTRADPHNYLEMLYEKSKNLFAGYDLRNLLSHRNNIPEVIGEALDKDDFPSEMIEKIMKWINDIDAIEAMLELFKKSGVIEEKALVQSIKDSTFPEQFSNLVKTVKDCDKWDKYLKHFPLVKAEETFG